MSTVKQYQKGGTKKKPFELQDERNLVQRDNTIVSPKHSNKKEFKNIILDDVELAKTMEIKNPRAEANKIEKSLPNKETVDFFNKIKKEAGADYFTALLKIQNERGNPKVNVGTDKGLPFSARRNYNPFTNEVNIPKGLMIEDDIENYIKEVSHAGQPLINVAGKFLANDVPGYIKAAMSNSKEIDNLNKYVYNNPNTVEFYTHNILQPKLMKEVEDFSAFNYQNVENTPKFQKGGQKTDKERQAYAFYISRGWTPEQAIGIVANLKHESNFDTSKVGTADDKGSQGVAQWHSGRLKALKNKYGSGWTDFQNQLEFVDWELKNTHKAAGDKLKNSKGAWEAGRIVSDYYEIPKVRFNADERRQTHVANAAMKFKGVKLSPEDNINYGINYENSVAPYMNAPQAQSTPLPTIQVPEMQTQQVSYLETPPETTNLAVTEEVEQLKINPQEEAFMQDLISQMAEGVGYVEPEKSAVFQDGGKRKFKLQDERNLVQKDNTPNTKRDLSLMLAEYNNTKKDEQELRTTGQIKNPSSIQYKRNVKTQPEIKQDNISTEQRNAQLNPLQRPLIYLANPSKVLGDLGVPNMETSELDRQAINANKFNPNQSNTDRFINNAKIGLGYVPEATVNTALAAAFMPEGSGALGLMNETLNPLAGLKTSIPDSMKDGLHSNGILSNIYKINPWANKTDPLLLKIDPNAYYRGIGEAGYQDLLNNKILRSKSEAHFPDPYFIKGSTPGAYGNGYIAELKNEAVNFKGSGFDGTDIFTSKAVNSENPNLKIYKDDGVYGYKEISKTGAPLESEKHWLKGYKQVEVPKTQKFKSEIDWENWVKTNNMSWDADDIKNINLNKKEYDVIEQATKSDGSWMKYNKKVLDEEKTLNNKKLFDEQEKEVNIKNAQEVEVRKSAYKTDGAKIEVEERNKLLDSKFQDYFDNASVQWKKNFETDPESKLDFLDIKGVNTKEINNTLEPLLSNIKNRKEDLLAKYENIPTYKYTRPNESVYTTSVEDFPGTPEQFIQSNSENFKKAYPEGWETVWRGGDDNPNLKTTYYRNSDGVFTSKDEYGANVYNRSDEPKTKLRYGETPSKGLKKLYTPQTENKIVIDGDDSYITTDGRKIAGDRYRTNYARLNTMNQTPITSLQEQNLNSFKKWMRKDNPEVDLSDKTMTDHFAYFLNTPEGKGIDRVEFKKIFDGTIDPIDVEYHNLHNKKQLKSMFGNNGMFDMTNPNIYKSIAPIAGASYLATQGQEPEKFKEGGQIPISSEGMYAYPNQPVIIPSSRITMKNIPHSILAITDQGDRQILQPEKEYQLKGNNTLEIPLTQTEENFLKDIYETN